MKAALVPGIISVLQAREGENTVLEVLLGRAQIHEIKV